MRLNRGERLDKICVWAKSIYRGRWEKKCSAFIKI